MQPVDYSKFDLSNVFDDFVPPKFTLLREEGGDNMIAAPNCWGGYGFTVNTDKVAAEDQESVNLLFNESTRDTSRPAPDSRRTSRSPASGSALV